MCRLHAVHLYSSAHGFVMMAERHSTKACLKMALLCCSRVSRGFRLPSTALILRRRLERHLLGRGRWADVPFPAGSDLMISEPSFSQIQGAGWLCVKAKHGLRGPWRAYSTYLAASTSHDARIQCIWFLIRDVQCLKGRINPQCRLGSLESVSTPHRLCAAPEGATEKFESGIIINSL